MTAIPTVAVSGDGAVRRIAIPIIIVTMLEQYATAIKNPILLIMMQCLYFKSWQR
jgi:hypothetical protein